MSKMSYYVAFNEGADICNGPVCCYFVASIWCTGFVFWHGFVLWCIYFGNTLVWEDML